LNIDEILQSYIKRSGVVRVKTALNPLLWAMPVLVLGSLLSAYFVGPEATTTLSLLGMTMLMVLTIIAAYGYFMFKDPDRLQSEEYMLAQKELSILERKGEEPVVIDPTGRSAGKAIEMQQEPPLSDGER
jgi:hypothetical protein